MPRILCLNFTASALCVFAAARNNFLCFFLMVRPCTIPLVVLSMQGRFSLDTEAAFLLDFLHPCITVRLRGRYRFFQAELPLSSLPQATQSLAITMPIRKGSQHLFLMLEYDAFLSIIFSHSDIEDFCENAYHGQSAWHRRLKPLELRMVI
jgi:hypothetical protein